MIIARLNYRVLERERERARIPSKNGMRRNGIAFSILLFSFIFSFGLLLNPHPVHADITSNLVGHWTFDSVDTTWVASTTNDTSGNNNTGSLNNFYSATSTVPGVINEALLFNGTNSYIDCGTNSSVLPSTFSFSVWAKINNTSVVSSLIAFANSNASDIKLNGSGNMPILKMGGNNERWFSATTPTNLNNTNWHHYVFIVPGNATTSIDSSVLYVDGQVQSIYTTNDTSAQLGKSLCRIGMGQNTFENFNGIMDDVRLYNRVLSSSDVTQLFATGFTPTVTTAPASSITGTTAILNGSIDIAIASSTVRGFAYGTSATLATVIATTTENGIFGMGAFTASISGLSDGTTYYFRAYASNATSTGYGSIRLFSSNPPTVTTSPASLVATSTITLNGAITATGINDATQSGFAYGTTANLSSVIATTTLGPQSGTASFLSNLTGLTPNTEYYFRAYAVNSAGTSTGEILWTTTLAVSAPTVTTQAVSSIATTSVTANGTITSTGNINPTVEGFVYGTSLSYGATTTLSGNFGTGAFTSSITSLTCNTLYHIAAYASNTQGISYGSDQTFKSFCDADITTGLQAWWKFNDGSGTSATDSSGNGNTGVLTNGPAWTTGVDGGALSFDGTNDYVTVPYNSSLNMTDSDATLAFWYLPIAATSSSEYTPFSVHPPYVGKEYSFGSPSYGFSGSSVVSDLFQVDQVQVTSATGTDILNSTAKIYPNKWYYYIAVFHDTGTSTVISIYLNGALIRTVQSSLRIGDSGNRFLIGMQGGFSAKGKIDDVRIWNRDLTNANIQTLYSLFSAPINPTNDVTPPVISTPYPRGILPANSHYIILSVKTDEVASCKYDTNPGIAFASMANTFSTTLQVEHNTVIKGIADGQSYTYYVKCQDLQSNADSQDYPVSFSTAPPIPFQQLSPTHSGNYWFVSPTGSVGGSGSINSPWDLQTALNQPTGVNPGDTVWMRGGIYGTGIGTLFTSTLSGTSGNNIIVRQYPGERAIIDGNMNITGPYSTLWGIEFFNSDTVRLFDRFAAETGHLSVSPNVTLINLVVHDLADTAIGYQSNGGTIYGTIMWGNGGYDYGISGDIGSPTLTGSGMYLQNNTGNKYIEDNVSFKEYTTGFKAYTEQGYANGFDIEGNVNFNNGQYNMFASAITNPIHDLVIKNNYLYRDASNNDAYGLELNHYGSDMINATVQDNYFVGGGYISALKIHKWQTLNVTGNTVVSLPPWAPVGMAQEAPVVTFDQAASVGGYTWDNNTYYADPTSVQSLFNVDGVAKTLAQVRSSLGIDANSTYTQTLPTQNVIVVRPNQYESGRGNIVVYNWQNSAYVDVDISSLGLASGDYFEVYDVQNLFGQAVYSGVYNGGTIRLPTNLTDTQPMLGTTVNTKLTHTDPLFNDFLVKEVPITPSIVSTQTASSITSTGATLNGSIDNINGSYVTSRGFVYGTSALYGATTTELGSFSTSTFSTSISGLTCNTTYHYALYAVNSAGTSTYPTDTTFTTSACPSTGGNTPSGGGSPGGGGGGGGTSPYYILTVTKQGTGLGTATSSPLGITCGSTCSYSFYAGSTVVLNALPQTGSHLTSWTGCTSIATSSCTVMLSASKTIIVNFNLGSATTTITNTAPVSLSNCPTGLICTPISGGGLSTTTPLITKLLSIGSIDPQVILLQELLNGNGYPVTTSGAGSLGHEIVTFGPATLKALQKFQCAKLSICSGTTLTTGYGSTDQQTRNTLNALPNRPTGTTVASLCPTGQVCTPIAPSTTYSPFSTSFTRSLTLGSTGSDVTLLQETLNSLGYIIATTGNGSPGHESTYFGPATQAALERYQCSKRIACSGDPGYGMMGPRTIASIGGKTLPVTITTPATTTIIPTKTTITVPTHIPIPTPAKVSTPTPSATTSIKVSTPTSHTPAPTPTPVKASTPTPATSATQSSAPSPTTPPVSNFSIPQSTNVSSVSGLPLFTAPLSTGSTGKEVKNLQIFLNDLGFTVNETQTYDTATAAAVKRFQKAYSSQIASYGGGALNGVFDGPTMEAANGVIGG